LSATAEGYFALLGNNQSQATFLADASSNFIFGDRGTSLRYVCFAVFFCAAASILLVYSQKFGNVQNADNILTTIMSYQRVTLFYWGQNRPANVAPRSNLFRHESAS
jgi:hypothetical protein